MSELSAYCTFISFKKQLSHEDLPRLIEMLRIFEEHTNWVLEVACGETSMDDAEDLRLEIDRVLTAAVLRIEEIAACGNDNFGEHFVAEEDKLN